MRLIDAYKLYPDCLTKNGTLAISQSQIANAQTVETDNEYGAIQYSNGFNDGFTTAKDTIIQNIAKQYSEHNELVPEWLSIGDMRGDEK